MTSDLYFFADRVNNVSLSVATKVNVVLERLLLAKSYELAEWQELAESRLCRGNGAEHKSDITLTNRLG